MAAEKLKWKCQMENMRKLYINENFIETILLASFIHIYYCIIQNKQMFYGAFFFVFNDLFLFNLNKMC